MGEYSPQYEIGISLMGKDGPSFIEPNRCNCTALRKALRRVSQFYDTHAANDPGAVGGAGMDQSTIGQNLRPLGREGG
jgi:hypothetical protein